MTSERTAEDVLIAALVSGMSNIDAYFSEMVCPAETDVESFLATTIRLHAMLYVMRASLKRANSRLSFAEIEGIEADGRRAVLGVLVASGKLPKEDAMELDPGHADVIKNAAQPAERPPSSADEIIGTIERGLYKN